MAKIEPRIFDELKIALSSFGGKYFVGEELNRSKVTDDLRNYDEALLSKLFEVEFIKQHFIKEVAGQKLFQIELLEEAILYSDYWDTSYTKYENRVGLASRKKFLQDSQDVILDFPFKDSVLTASMTKEDNEDGYDDAFLNEVIEKDEIDRLFDKKIFRNAVKYNENGENPVVKFDKDTDNLIIKGNNLLALHTLGDKYANSVKLIFIDPPYNTGSDSFVYNDKFNHSAWLTFMKNRLEVARSLLTPDGSIAVYVDNNEVGYLQVLMDEIFHRDNRGSLITVKRGSVTGHKAINPGVVNVVEYIMIYAKDKSLWNPNKVFRARERNERYNNFILNRSKDVSQWEIVSLLDAFSKNVGIEKNKLKKSLGANYEKEIYKFVKDNAESVIQFAYPDINAVGQETRELIVASKAEPDKIFIQKRDKGLDIYLKNGQRLLFYSDRLMLIDGELVTGELVTDFWDDVLPNDLAGEGGVIFKKGKKTEKAVKRVIELLTNDSKDIVLDFFMGSGTIPTVCHKMDRPYIGIEQMDYIDSIAVKRLMNVIAGADKKGVTKAVGWQGGGSFVYAQLFPKNMGYLQDVIQSKTIDELKSVYERMLLGTDIEESADISFRADLSKIDWAEGFDNNKRLLIKLLDKNGLYYNYSEIDDKNVRDLISNEDYAFNKAFYEGGE
ncbi:DNA methyltransferase [Paenibacillus polymyxa]|uniref:DNA methyltransferase n=1 Tax=Paenibacillus polymyxa TaxID=1406 RepID=UPI00129BF332|nr:site-specific DNA-methyltransferase [Paenibacillus polymyxa]KAE8561482.1 type III restriction endonuclease subunit M [Paenibacillus polymyxa]MCJ1222887.1 site-specific DNA-methyltransferase [Paenibacillus polymyxa]